MKKHIFCLLLLLCAFPQVSNAQSATPQLWRKLSPEFTTESQLKTLAKRYANDSRMSYYLILRAFHKSKVLRKSAVLTYYDLHNASPENVRLQAAFAFASYIATDYDLEASPLQDTELRQLSWQALNLRPATVKAFPTDPTILLMAARPTYFNNKVGIKENLTDMKRGLEWAKRSAHYGRNWAESHYWLAKILQYYAMNNPITATKETDRNIMRQSIAPALTALHLGTKAGDRVTQIGCWNLLASGYTSTRKDDQKALYYLDKYIAALPPFMKQRHHEVLTIWRRDLVNRIAKAKQGG